MKFLNSVPGLATVAFIAAVHSQMAVLWGGKISREGLAAALAGLPGLRHFMPVVAVIAILPAAVGLGLGLAARLKGPGIAPPAIAACVAAVSGPLLFFCWWGIAWSNAWH